MVKSVREAESVIGLVDYSLTDKQIKGKDFSRSLYIFEDVEAGELLSTKNVRSIRLGFGLHPNYFDDILGKTINCNFRKGDRLSFINL